MTTDNLTTGVGPQMTQDSLPIPIAIVMAALLSAPLWAAMGLMVAAIG